VRLQDCVSGASVRRHALYERTQTESDDAGTSDDLSQCLVAGVQVISASAHHLNTQQTTSAHHRTALETPPSMIHEVIMQETAAETTVLYKHYHL